MKSVQIQRLRQVAFIFLKLGFTAFGGPAAHISMFHEEVVKRRKWLTDDGFLDLLGATNLIPGPNSTEMALHIGYLRAGMLGLVVAGFCFIAPAAFIVLILSWLYVQYGTLPQVGWLLYGVKPVVIAIIIQALWSLGGKAFKSNILFGVGLVTFLLYLLRVNEIVLLFGGGLIVMVIKNFQRLRMQPLPLLIYSLGIRSWVNRNLAILLSVSQVPVSYNLVLLFLTCFKIGAILYGSGYVLLAFLRTDFVLRFGWLTDGQLLDAIAIGQFTPGPLFTAVTFIGYLLDGTNGAILATLGFLLPSFIFVALSNPLIPHIRASAWFSTLLDGVNASSLGLMAGVLFQLTKASLTDFVSSVIAITSLIILVRFKINTAWLIVAGSIVGLLSSLHI